MGMIGASVVSVERIGDFTLTWGESLRWDDRRRRLYFVDCATQSLYWLDRAEPPLQEMRLPSMPTGVVLTEGDSLVVCLDGGLHVVDPDNASVEMLAPYPEGMHGRANDANGDGAGNIITGTLNLGPGPGALWQYSAADEWRRLDEPFGNTNGPVVVDMDGGRTLVVGDTTAQAVYRYSYDSAAGQVAARETLNDHGAIGGGAPDGACADAEGGVWSCVLRSGKIARLDAGGLDRTLDVPMPNPSSVCFGGPDLRTAFVTSIALALGGETKEVGQESSWLVAMDIGATGRPEDRFCLA